MHDIDRTQQEFETAMQEVQPEHFEFAEYGEGDYGEVPGELAQEGLQEAGLYASELGEYETGLNEFSELPEVGLGETYEGEGEAGETQELELAAELLEVTNEQELDRFLGKLIRTMGRKFGGPIRSPLGRALGGILKPLAKAALPLAGRAVGTFFGGPLGGMAGGKLASAAGRLFGLELEGLSAEDREFEVARRFVRYAGGVVRNAASASPAANPLAVTQAAAASAAGALAPGVLSAAAAPFGAPAMGGLPGSRRGFWYRARGNRIVLVGV